MGKTVVLVEDEPLIAMDLAATLRGAGWDVLGTPSNGEDAVSMFERGLHPTAVLIDINLGMGIDGITAAERIRAYDTQVFVLFNTSYTDAKTLARAEQVSPSGFIDKSLGRRVLLATLEALPIG